MAYVAGVLDTMKDVVWESLTLAESSEPPLSYKSKDVRDSSSPSDKSGTAALAVTVKLAAMITEGAVPEGVTMQQFSEITTKYILEHPESRHETGAALVWKALIDAFWE